MSTDDYPRRWFLQHFARVAGSVCATAYWPQVYATGQAAVAAADQARPLKHLSGIQARELGAVAEQIVPRTQTPGATDAGVVHFFDQSLEGFIAGPARSARDGVEPFTALLRAQHPEDEYFSQLPFDAQTRFLTTQESTGFFQTVRFLTLLGLFAMPAYGGNRDHAGWDILGFKHRHVWQPPFGYYDAALLAKEGK